MPMYSYRCPECENEFDELRVFSKREDPAECKECGCAEAKTFFNPGDSVGVAYKGWGWGDKCRKFGEYRTKKSKEMKKIQRDHYGNDTFVKRIDE